MVESSQYRVDSGYFSVSLSESSRYRVYMVAMMVEMMAAVTSAWMAAEARTVAMGEERRAFALQTIDYMVAMMMESGPSTKKAMYVLPT